MYLGVILILLFLCLSSQHVIQPDVSENSEPANETAQSEVLDLEKMVTSLNDVANAHKQILEKQIAHEEEVRKKNKEEEEEMRKKNKEEEEREATRTKALEKEQIYLRERSRSFSRKLKHLSRSFAYNGQSVVLGDTSMSSIVNKVKDCTDVYLEGDETSGVYRLWPSRYQDGRGFSAYCDMDTDRGGWTVIHRRTAGGFLSDYYSRSWNDYKHGFGDLESSFWLGNEKLHQLTNQGAYELRVDVEANGQKSHSVYQTFFIEDETTNYKLHVAGYRSDGTEGDVMTSHNGAKFSTYDQNNLPQYLVSKSVYRYGGYQDEEIYKSPPGCAEGKACGWWYKTDCELDEKLKLTQNIGKMEMKIRQSLYSQKIRDSKQSVPLIR